MNHARDCLEYLVAKLKSIPSVLRRMKGNILT